MIKAEMEEIVTDLLWYNAEKQYYSYCEHKIDDDNVYAFTIKELANFFEEVEKVVIGK